MQIADAQREMREAFLGGAFGQLVSGLLWLSSAALATWGSRRWAILVLVFGGMAIFPLAALLNKLVGRAGRVSSGNALNGLGMQIAFTVPIGLPVAGAAALYKLNWFYPAVAILIGAHYLPFVFLYGMRMYAVLGGAMISAGLLIGLYWSGAFTTAGWVTAGLLLAFALVARQLQLREERAATG